MRGCSFALGQIGVIRSGRTILEIDTLRIEPGEFVNLIGANGAGKTTLMKLLCGLIRPQRGRVYMDEAELTALAPWRKTAQRRRIGYIPQSAEYNAQLPFTAREVALMGRGAVRGLLRPLTRCDHELTDGWLARLGLAGLARQTFRSLSGGEQQKVLIARAMAQEPAVLMLDEPTSNLDWNWKRQIVQTVHDLHRQLGLTVVMISHELQGLPFDAGRTILLNEGRIAAQGDSAAVMAGDPIRRIYPELNAPH